MRAMCSFCGEATVYAHGLCTRCYMRWRRNGTPEYKVRTYWPKRGPYAKTKAVLESYQKTGSYAETARQFGISRQAVYEAVKKWKKPTNGDMIRKMSDEELVN